MAVQNQLFINPCSQTEPFCLTTALISPCMTSLTTGRDTVPLQWCGANRRGKDIPQFPWDAKGSRAGAAIERWGICWAHCPSVAAWSRTEAVGAPPCVVSRAKEGISCTPCCIVSLWSLPAHWRALEGAAPLKWSFAAQLLFYRWTEELR